MTHPVSAETRQRRLDVAFDLLTVAAIRGERCPENGAPGINSAVVSALARAGFIRVLITSMNYRQVEILTGEAAGKFTQRAPSGGKPWKIIDSGGTRTHGKWSSGKSKAPITLASRA